MTATATRGPVASQFTTQHACPDSETVLEFYGAIKRARYIGMTDWQPGTAMHLRRELALEAAIRVEMHLALAADSVFWDFLEQPERDKHIARCEAVAAEAARTVMVVLGAQHSRVTPVDYPTVARAFLMAMNAGGHLS